MFSFQVYRMIQFNQGKFKWLCVCIKDSKNEAIHWADMLRDKANVKWVVVMKHNSQTKEKQKVYERHGRFIRG